MATAVLRRTICAVVLCAAAGCTVGETGAPEQPGRVTTGAQDAAAAELLASARRALEAGEAAEALRTANRIMELHSRTPAALPARWVGARAAYELGDYGVAIELAESYASRVGGREAEEARALVERARTARARAAETIRVGAILPETGPDYLRQYGELVMQGIQLAFDDAGRGIELVVLDDAGDPLRSAQVLDELESRGVRAVIGPMLTRGLVEAARARDGELVLVSPTASETPSGLRGAYTLNAPDTRGADSIARYAVAAGAQTAAILFPRMIQHEQEAYAFRETFEGAGGHIVEWIGFDSATTTFAAQLERVAQAGPDVMFLPLSPRVVRLLAPQISYYGLDSLVVLGNDAWVDPEVLRLVSPGFLEGVVAAAQQGAALQGPAWTDFVQVYEQRYRRSLDNPFPALGYDAARLVIDALVPGQNDPAEVARRLAAGLEVEGASGTLAVREGTLTRRPFLVRIRNGALEPAPPPSLLLPAQPVGSGTGAASGAASGLPAQRGTGGER